MNDKVFGLVVIEDFDLNLTIAREFDRIFHQVGQHLHQPSLIADKLIR